MFVSVFIHKRGQIIFEKKHFKRLKIESNEKQPPPTPPQQAAWIEIEQDQMINDFIRELFLNGHEF